MEYQIPPCFYRVSVKALIYNETKDKFLVTLENNGTWEVPGGGLDWGEDPVACVTREIEEETGLKIIEVGQNPKYMYTCQHSNGNWILCLVYEIKVKDLNFRPSDECTDVKFVDLEDVQNMKVFNTVTELAKKIKNG
ncbi:MAG: NUDIX hydrolase [Minisyncoccia bacterium]